MTRVGFLATAVVGVSALSLGVYAMKYEVERLEDRADALRHAIWQQEEMLHVLEAEWSYLNAPARLQELAARHLDLVPPGVRQVGAFDDIPFRVAARPADGRTPLLRPIPPASLAQAAPAIKREGP